MNTFEIDNHIRIKGFTIWLLYIHKSTYGLSIGLFCWANEVGSPRGLYYRKERRNKCQI